MTERDASLPTDAPAWLDRKLFPFRHRFLEIEGCTIHYLDEGSGPTLLFLHGNPTWSFAYREIVVALRDRFRCVALDYPGFGLSRAAADYGFTPAEHARIVEWFGAELDLNQITMMVHDWGGPIGLSVAERHPAKFHGLIVGNSFAWPIDGDPILELFARTVGGPLGRLAIRRFNAFVNCVIPIGVRRSALPDSVMRAYRGPFPTDDSRRPTYVLPAAFRASRPFLREVARDLPRLQHLPTLIVWGDLDPAFRAPQRRRFERALPLHRTIILAGAGHYIQEDAPAEIATAIGEWWPAMVGDQSRT